MGIRWSRPVLVCAVAVAALAIAIALASAATITTGNGSDDVVGTSDPDVIESGNGNDVVHAGSGADVVRGGNGNDQLFGEAGADELFGANGNDDLDGGLGSDTGWGANGNDTFVGGDAHDVFDGDNGNDTATGGPGLDVLFADKGNDSLSGGADTDVLAMIATGGNPVLDGGAGRDVLVSARGAISGGDGADVIAASGSATVNAGAGDDTCYLQAGVNATGCEHVVTLANSSQAASLVLTDAPDDGATITSDHLSFSVSTEHAAAVWCVASTGQVQECSDGDVTIDGLTNGPQAIAVVAVSDGSKVPAVQVRRFDVELPDVAAGIDAAASTAPDTLVVDAHALATVSAIRASFEDGGGATWQLDDERLVVDPAPSSGSSQITIVDPNVGHERVTSIALLDSDAAVVAWECLRFRR
ncbi:MAG: hypothetical protein KDC46_05830, partial [Thermoleophilia bacterium]|nr:hypothetical protein [Thermoleophilia bacterium]